MGLIMRRVITRKEAYNEASNNMAKHSLSLSLSLSLSTPPSVTTITDGGRSKKNGEIVEIAPYLGYKGTLGAPSIFLLLPLV